MKKIATFVSIFGFLILTLPLTSLSQEKNDQYKVVPRDTLEIIVYEEPDLSGTFEIKENGTITYPLLGQVEIAGLTKLQIENKISSLLRKDYLVNPYVRVSIESKSHKHKVLLLGHVKTPGTYDLPDNENLTLMELITRAGGFTGYASINGTKIVRTKDNGEKIIIVPRVNDIIRGRKKDIELKAEDLIIVPERFF